MWNKKLSGEPWKRCTNERDRYTTSNDHDYEYNDKHLDYGEYNDENEPHIKLPLF